MKKFFLLTTFSFFTALATLAQSTSIQKPASANRCPIVPLPEKAFVMNGHVMLSSLGEIRIDDPAFHPVAHFLQNEILEDAGLTLAVAETADFEGVPVTFTKDAGLSHEGYRLSINPTQITITASTAQGSFYGAMSLLQLIRIAALEKSGNAAIPSGRSKMSLNSPGAD